MEHLILSKKQIAKITADIGHKLSKDLAKEKKIPVVIGIMKGSMNFMMDVMKNLEVDVFTDYIQVSSYNGTKTTGKVILKRDLSFDIKGRTVVVIEDIVDTGVSMNYLMDFLKDRYHPKRIILVALVDKRSRRKEKVKIDYAGMILKEDEFLLGYGLDYNELGRNLPEIYGLTNKEVRKLAGKINKEII